MGVIKKIFSEDEETRIKAGGYFWNMVSALISSGQSVFIMFFIAHFIDTASSGVFAIGYALAILANTIAKYGVRTYQVTDVEGKFSQSEYVSARFVCAVAVVILSIGYCVVMTDAGKYTVGKSIIIVLIICWKLVEAVEDVFVGVFQQQNRLDVGAFISSLRMGFSTVLYCLTILVFRDLMISTVITALLSIVVSAALFLYTNRLHGNRFNISVNKSLLLFFIECFPFFVSKTINIFVGNLPKYLVDGILNDEAQAYLGYIIVPAYVIGLMSGFIYQPEMKIYGVLWNDKKISALKQKVIRQTAVILVAILVIGFVCGICGVQILSVFYKCDLSHLWKEFMILIAGGGIYALVSYYMIVLTAMRKQKLMLYSYLVTAVVSILLGYLLVSKYEIYGAAILFVLINTILCFVFVLAIMFCDRSSTENKVTGEKIC